MTDMWSIDNDIVSGLNNSSLGYYTLPEVFSIGENIYLMSSASSTIFRGFILSGGSWASYPSIVNGMPSGVANQSATVFNLSGIDYCIVGDNNDHFFGRKWNGSSWNNEPSIISGLPGGDQIWDKTPTAFYMNDQLCLIYTAWNGSQGITHLRGFKWNGSTWIEDTSIVNGLSIPSNSAYRAIVFLYGTTYKCILGRWSPASGSPAWYGYSREGSTWIVDNDIISGLTTQNYILGGDVFTKDNTIYFIAGDWYGGDVINFYGFKSAALSVGHLDINSYPDNAEIYIDDYLLSDLTPAIIDMPSGTYNLRVHKDGYADYTEIIIITTDFTLYRSVTLPPIVTGKGPIDIKSTPPGAKIYIDNVLQLDQYGQPLLTPVMITGIPVGDRYVELTLAGYQDWTATVPVVENTILVIDVTLVQTAIVATSIDASPGPYIQPSTMIVTVMWQNTGGSTESFDPAITITKFSDGITAHMNLGEIITLNPTEFTTQIFSIPDLMKDTYTICPYPN